MNARRSDVIFPPQDGRRRVSASGGRRAPLSALARTHEGLEFGDFLIAEAGQRGAFPRDPRLRANIDEDLVVDLQFFG